MRYGVPGLPSGWYDTITEPDGSSHSAFGLLGNTLTVEIAYEAVSASGRNTLCVLVLDANGYQLGAWNLALQVEITPGENAPESTQYYSLLSAQVAQVLASVTDAENAATLAESWAVGGTGTRTGEDTNNAKYWAGQAAASAGQSLGFRTFSAAVSPDPVSGDVDPTSPMLMANLTVTSAADRLDHVVVPGKTVQAGSGDPSPSNVRPLSGVGRKMVALPVTSSMSWTYVKTSGGADRFEAQVDYPWPVASTSDNAKTSQFCNELVINDIDNVPGGSCIYIRNGDAVPTTSPVLRMGVAGISSVAALKQHLDENNVILYYVPEDESQATDWYTYAAASGDTYSAVGLELDGPLFDGDSINNNAETPSGRQCAVYRVRKLFEFDGSPDETWNMDSVNGGVRFHTPLGNEILASDTTSGPTSECNYLPLAVRNGTYNIADVYTINAWSTGVSLFVRITGVNTVDALRTYLAQTPLQVLATLAAPTTTYSTAQPLANPAGTWTLSAENTPQGYMRALSDANHADVADAATTAETANTADQLAGQSPAWYMPPGLMAPYAGSAAPAGWLLCDGSTVSRTTYAALFAAIGTTFGDGDGNTTFALPDMRGNVPAGVNASNALASKAGADSKQITRANLPAEKLNLEDNGTWIVDSTQTGSESGKTLQMGTRSGAARLETNTLGSGTAFDVRQATLYLNYIIKY